MIISEGFADSEEHRHFVQEAFQHIKNITGTVLLFTELPKFKMDFVSRLFFNNEGTLFEQSDVPHY